MRTFAQEAKPEPRARAALLARARADREPDRARRALAPTGPQDFSRIPVRPSPSPGQPTLTLGALDDPCEADADRLADHVLNTRELAVRPGAAKPLSPRSSGARPRPGGLAAPPLVHAVLRDTGQPLDAATRAFMEPRLGWDLSRVARPR